MDGYTILWDWYGLSGGVSGRDSVGPRRTQRNRGSVGSVLSS